MQMQPNPTRPDFGKLLRKKAKSAPVLAAAPAAASAPTLQVHAPEFVPLEERIRIVLCQDSARAVVNGAQLRMMDEHLLHVVRHMNTHVPLSQPAYAALLQQLSDKAGELYLYYDQFVGRGSELDLEFGAVWRNRLFQIVQMVRLLTGGRTTSRSGNTGFDERLLYDAMREASATQVPTTTPPIPIPSTTK